MRNLIVIQIYEMKQKNTELTEVEECTTELANWATESSIPASSVSGLLSVCATITPPCQRSNDISQDSTDSIHQISSR